MPRVTITDKDIDSKNPDRLRRRLQDAYDQIYDLMSQMSDVRTKLADAQAGGLSPAERAILRALTIGSTETAVPAQVPVIPTVTALPPVNVSTPGQLVRFGGVVYVFDGSTWSPITASASAHNILSATHGDSVAAAVVRGDLIVGNATPKWARLAKGAANLGLVVDGAGNDLTWAAVGQLAIANNWSTEQSFQALIAIALGGGANTHGAKTEFQFQDEEITLSTVALTTDSAGNLLIGSSLVFPLMIRITQTISGGGVTKWRIGDPTTNDRFGGDSSTLSAGSTFWAGIHWGGSIATDARGPSQPSVNKVRITTDAIPTAGKIRVVTMCLTTTGPTS